MGPRLGPRLTERGQGPRLGPRQTDRLGPWGTEVQTKPFKIKSFLIVPSGFLLDCGVFPTIHIQAAGPHVMSEIICCDETLDGRRTSEELYVLSTPCQLSECDTFLSHSWHDDAHLKWAALEMWCEDFRSQHGRAPTLWLDTVCIDQADIVSFSGNRANKQNRNPHFVSWRVPFNTP